MLMSASPISLMALRIAGMPRSRRALTTMDGVIGSPSPLRTLSGRAQAGAACCLLPTAHSASRANNGPSTTAYGVTICTM